MALIKCPECGTEVSDKATVCIKCGYPIKGDVKQDSSSNALNSMPLGNNTTAAKAQSKMSTKTLIIVAVSIIAVGAIIALLIGMNRPGSLPYGLNANMGASEIKAAMRDNGFRYEHTNGNDIYFESNTVYGVRTKFSVVSYEIGSYLYIKHFYNKLSDSQYSTVKNGLSKEYGFAKSRSQPWGGFEWEKGQYVAIIDDKSDDTPVITISYRADRKP